MKLSFGLKNNPFSALKYVLSYILILYSVKWAKNNPIFLNPMVFFFFFFRTYKCCLLGRYCLSSVLEEYTSVSQMKTLTVFYFLFILHCFIIGVTEV